jgi:hypothetical protein
MQDDEDYNTLDKCYNYKMMRTTKLWTSATTTVLYKMMRTTKLWTSATTTVQDDEDYKTLDKCYNYSTR